jgi:lysophospholipase L1-like esterase
MQSDETFPINLEITAETDSVIAVRDTLKVTMQVDGTLENEITYYWVHDDSRRIDSTTSSEFATVWHFPDTGMHTLIVHAVASDRRTSNFDTVNIFVKCFIPIITVSGDTFAFINDTIAYRVAASDSDGVIDHILLTTGGGVSQYTPYNDTIRIRWAKSDTGYKTLSVQAVDDDGLKSGWDSLTVYVDLSIPVATLHSDDSSISINDTALFLCNGSDSDGYIAAYEWFIDSKTTGYVIVHSDSLQWVWRYPDTGMHMVGVRIIDEDGCTSMVDSMTVHVSALSPTATIQGKKEIMTGESEVFTAAAYDEDGTVANYHWTIKTASGDTSVTSVDSFFSFSWDIDDTGKQEVILMVTDDDSLKSQPSICTLLVKSNLPVLKSFSDTVISSLDTLVIHRTLKDTMQKALMYYWDVNGSGWDDSSTTPICRVSYAGNAIQTIVCGIKNDASLLYRDTLRITFNRPPVIKSISLLDSATIWCGENGIPGTIPFDFTVSDADGESLATYIIWGRGEVQDTIICSDATRLSIDTTAVYHWHLHVSDEFGNHIVKEGNSPVGIEHTICFAGHSIVVGVGDTTFSGGFRSGVLAGLRDSIGPFERIRATGPLTTDSRQLNSSDDSSFALSSTLAREMLLLMDHGYPELTADIWVLMFGVNGGFDSRETQATVDMLSRMFTRNPKARVYVLTSQPFSPVTDNSRDYFNGTLRESVASLKAQEYSAFIVESGDSILADGTVFNDTLIYKGDNYNVHPNAEGYRRLASGILKVMWEREPRVFTPGKQE